MGEVDIHLVETPVISLPPHDCSKAGGLKGRRISHKARNSVTYPRPISSTSPGPHGGHASMHPIVYLLYYDTLCIRLDVGIMGCIDIHPSLPTPEKRSLASFDETASFLLRISTQMACRGFPKNRFGRSRRVQDGQCRLPRLPITRWKAGREAAPHFSSFSIAGFACRRSLIKTMA